MRIVIQTNLMDGGQETPTISKPTSSWSRSEQGTGGNNDLHLRALHFATVSPFLRTAWLVAAGPNSTRSAGRYGMVSGEILSPIVHCSVCPDSGYEWEVGTTVQTGMRKWTTIQTGTRSSNTVQTRIEVELPFRPCQFVMISFHKCRVHHQQSMYPPLLERIPTIEKSLLQHRHCGQ